MINTQSWLIVLCKRIFECLAVAAVLGPLFYYYKLLAADIPLGYYDDGETLYHTMAILDGRIPYRGDFNHHFAGYLFPFVLGEKVFGFSPYLIKQVTLVLQTLCGIGVFLILRSFFSFWYSLLGACLAVSAREPWVLGFYPQYVVNVCVCFAIWACINALKYEKRLFMVLGYFLFGLALTVDQRACAYLLLPLIGSVLLNKQSKNQIPLIDAEGILAYVLPVTVGIGYLIANNALPEFIEQTIIFPTFYRSGSSTFSSFINLAIQVHSYLVSESPLLFLGFLCGLLYLIPACLSKDAGKSLRNSYILVLLWAIPATVMGCLGGRDFDYYTITWLPLMAVGAIFGAKYFSKKLESLTMAFSVFLLLPIALSLAITAIKLNENAKKSIYDGDGAPEVVAYLRTHMRQNDTLYVWGYRFEPYVYLRTLSAYPFTNSLMVHPDGFVKGEAERRKHIYLDYERLFFQLLDEHLSNYIVVFNSLDDPHGSSPFDSKLRDIIASRYNQVFQIKKKNFIDKNIEFVIYRLKE